MLELLKNRRSTRKYENKAIEEEKLERILKAGLLAASSKAKRAWEFIVVNNKDTNEKLALCKPFGAKMISLAPTTITIVGDAESSDVWIEDCSIAATLIQTQCEVESIGSCWVQIRERKQTEDIKSEQYVKDILEIPAKYRVLAIIAIGYKKDAKQGYTDDDYKMEKIHFDKF